jgi:hypothetical protein
LSPETPSISPRSSGRFTSGIAASWSFQRLHCHLSTTIDPPSKPSIFGRSSGRFTSRIAASWSFQRLHCHLWTAIDSPTKPSIFGRSSGRFTRGIVALRRFQRLHFHPSTFIKLLEASAAEMTPPVQGAVADLQSGPEINLTLADFVQATVGSRPEKNLAVGDWVYVLTNPHRGRKGQIIKKRGYTQWYIRLVPKNRREFPIIIYRARKHLYGCYSDDLDQFEFCYCSKDERDDESFVCPYWGCCH